jgi:hypothetical protein
MYISGYIFVYLLYLFMNVLIFSLNLMNICVQCMLVLRKAMFSRELEAKKVAVEGFMVLLATFRVRIRT